MVTKKTERSTAPMGVVAEEAKRRAEEAAAEMERAMLAAAAEEEAATKASLSEHFAMLEARQAAINEEAAKAAAEVTDRVAEGERAITMAEPVMLDAEEVDKSVVDEVLNDGSDIEISDEIAALIDSVADAPKKTLSAAKTARTLDAQIEEVAAQVMAEAPLTVSARMEVKDEPLYRNPVKDKAGTWTVELNHPKLGWIPFTASPDDDMDYGRDLHAMIEREHG